MRELIVVDDTGDDILLLDSEDRMKGYAQGYLDMEFHGVAVSFVLSTVQSSQMSNTAEDPPDILYSVKMDVL